MTSALTLAAHVAESVTSCKFTYGYLTQYITYLTILPSATYPNTIYFSDSSYQLPDVTDRIQVTAQVTIQRPITTIKVKMVLYSKRA